MRKFNWCELGGEKKRVDSYFHDARTIAQIEFSYGEDVREIIFLINSSCLLDSFVTSEGREILSMSI
ncbi:hypothetical protein Mic7113_1783 [Allocoleopsis franciscana PCC 7113]|uniref:Uncharacterized protein n=1 Tax=Allocoleopsis franciscana PCC 7113 TaxID=1173027 RepID=K9WCW3_9CYAN|nr:hypothetical protein Mic7113_1783 [Allocoleopsis franciscana PCC 7113]